MAEDWTCFRGCKTGLEEETLLNSLKKIYINERCFQYIDSMTFDYIHIFRKGKFNGL